ncbi:MAG TPA: metallophosphoesterase [Syntrophobacteria bacterium]|nr:metallophosphoesterase [Syntrophobacteria bacterium]
MARRTRTIWFFTLPLIVLLLAFWVGIFAGQSGADTSSFRFVVVADSRSNHNNPSVNSAVLRQLIADMNALNPTFCLFPGDLVYGGKVGNDAFKRQLQEWMAATGEFRAILYVAPRNHEFGGGARRADAWREMFPNMPGNGPPGEEYKYSYYFDYGNCRFISILSDWEDHGTRVDQKWLNQILGASSGFEHIFVFSHHPIRDLGGVKGAFWKSLVSHHVDAYFCGHSHFYNRSQPGNDKTWQVIVGTAGAPSYRPPPNLAGTTISGQYGFATVDVDGPNAKVTFYGDIDGDGHYSDVMDSFFIAVPKGGEERVSSGGLVGQPAATVEKRGCLMPGF